MRSSETDSPTTDFTLFLKIILTEEDMKQKLRMPPKFVRIHGNELSDVAKLNLPNGNVWQVGLRKSRNGICFEKGWQKFVEHYFISHGNFVIFRYMGESCFKVNIIDLSCCEIRYPTNEASNEEEVSHETGDSSHGSIPCSKTCLPEPSINSALALQNGVRMVEKTYLKQGHRTKPRMPEVIEMDVADSEHADDSRQGKWIDNRIAIKTKGKAKIRTNAKASLEKLEEEKTTCGKQFNSTSAKELESEPVKVIYLDAPGGSKTKKPKQSLNEAEFAATKTKVRNGCCRRECVRVKPHKLAFASPASLRAIQEAETFEPRNPSFMVLLTDNEIYQVYVPTKFANKYLGGAGDTIKIQSPCGREWSFGFVRKKGRYATHFMNTGWVDFVKMNYLMDGDVLVFEALDRADATLKVTFFRAE